MCDVPHIRLYHGALSSAASRRGTTAIKSPAAGQLKDERGVIIVLPSQGIWPLMLIDHPKSRPHLSVIAPLYNEEDNVDPLYEALTTALDPTGLDYEMVLVDDGSKTPRWPRPFRLLRTTRG